jgi:hypothetical protein
MAAAIWWALTVGPDQAGGDYVGRFVLAVGVAAILRLLLGAAAVKKELAGMLAKLGMVRKVAAS